MVEKRGHYEKLKNKVEILVRHRKFSLIGEIYPIIRETQLRIGRNSKSSEVFAKFGNISKKLRISQNIRNYFK